MLSVIVTVYNLREYITCCIESLLNQTTNEYEILVVDDGSTDGSDVICKKYQEKGKIIYLHKENGGISSARNFAMDYLLKNDQYNFFTFVDGDDYVSENFVKDLSYGNEDFICQSHVKVFENSDYIEKYNLSSYVSKDLTEKAKQNLWDNGTINYICSKRFSLEIIRENNIRFEEDLSLMEDSVFISEYIKHTKSIRVEEKINYYYVQYVRRKSLSSFNENSEEQIKRACISIFNNFNFPDKEKRIDGIDNFIYTRKFAKKINNKKIINKGELSFYFSLLQDEKFLGSIKKTEYKCMNKTLRIGFKKKSRFLIFFGWFFAMNKRAISKCKRRIKNAIKKSSNKFIK